MINTPKRGLGDKSLERLASEATMRDLSMIAYLRRGQHGLNSKQTAEMKKMLVGLDKLRLLADQVRLRISILVSLLFFSFSKICLN